MKEEKIKQIKRLYYRATASTIERDLAEAVSILKTLGDETTRVRAAVYMDGLSQMRSEWRLAKKRKKAPPKTLTSTARRKEHLRR